MRKCMNIEFPWTFYYILVMNIDNKSISTVFYLKYFQSDQNKSGTGISTCILNPVLGCKFSKIVGAAIIFVA